MNLHFKRSTKEAFGFYFAYLLLVLIISVIISVGIALIFKSSNFNSGFNMGLRIGTIIAVIISLGLSFLVLKEKKLLRNFGLILLALLSGLLAFFLGGLGGLIIASYLTTRPANH